MKTHYQTLGVPPCAAKERIREAYITLALRHHPDVKLTGNHQRFAAITEAYAVLKDTPQRMQYDKMLELQIKKCRACSGRGETIVLKQGGKVQEQKLCQRCAGSGQEE